MVSIETSNALLLKMCAIPLLGELVIAFTAAAPGFIIYPVTSAFGLGERTYMLAQGVAVYFWNLYLERRGTKIRLLWVPAWAWGIVIAVASFFL